MLNLIRSEISRFVPTRPDASACRLIFGTPTSNLNTTTIIDAGIGQLEFSKRLEVRELHELSAFDNSILSAHVRRVAE
jgi:hypothetical protein